MSEDNRPHMWYNVIKSDFIQFGRGVIRGLLQTADDTIALSYRAWNLVVRSVELAYQDSRPFVIGSGQRKQIRRYETFIGQGHAECAVLFEDDSTRHYTAEYR
jgi:hypothetical protein